MKCNFEVNSILYFHLKSLQSVFSDTNTLFILQSFIGKRILDNAFQVLNNNFNQFQKNHYFLRNELGSLLVSFEAMIKSFATEDGKKSYEKGYILNFHSYISKMKSFINYLQFHHLGNPNSEAFINFERIQLIFSDLETISIDDQLLVNLDQAFYAMMNNIEPFFKSSEKLSQMFKDYANYFEIALHELIYISALYSILNECISILQSIPDEASGEPDQIFTKKNVV